MNIQEELFKLQDTEYRVFQCRLMPTIDPDNVIGIRTPVLRKFSKDIYETPEASVFLASLPHKYYEENNLHGFMIERIKNYGEAIAAIEAFLPYIDNWATCDSVSPKVFKKNLPDLFSHIKIWLKSDKTYTVRYGIGMLMGYYLEDIYTDEVSELVAAVKSDEYYINMMRAWFFATALAKRYEDILPYIKEKKLDVWTHNKTIQKAIESYRISDERKAFLRSLKIQDK